MIDVEQLRGKTILITGASRGIGKETASLLAGIGAELVIGARDKDQLMVAAAGLDADILPLALDVTEERSVCAFITAALEKFGKIDALINCAGTGTFESFLHTSPADFDRMLSVNLRGTFLAGQMAARHMVSRRSGRIINVVSVAGTTALAGCAGYSASKFGVLGLTRVMQAELRKEGVQVSAIIPGAVATSFWDEMTDKPNESDMIPVQALAKHIVYLLCQPDGAAIDEITIMPLMGIL